MPPIGSTKKKDPKGKGSAVYFASQKPVRPPCNLLEGEIFKVPWVMVGIPNHRRGQHGDECSVVHECG